MNKLGLRIAVAAAALTVASSMVLADTATKKKKTGFFDSLFSSSPSKKKKKQQKKTLFSKNWWSENDDVRIIRSPESDITRKNVRRARIADNDPEGDPGFGMGNLTYVADKVVALAGAGLLEPRPAGAAEGAIHDALNDKELGLRVLPEVREAIVKQYQSQGFKPVWTTDGKLSPRGEAVLKQLAAASDEGLDPAQYLPTVLSSFDAPVPEGDAAAMARLDIGLTTMALKYARHASGGQFDPRRLSLYYDVVPAWVPAAQALKVLAWSPYPAEYLSSLHPKHDAYAALKAALAEARKETPAPAFEPIPDGKIVKAGQSDERLPAVRSRLAMLGFAEPLDNIAEDPLTLDKELSARLKAFQKSARIKVTGALGPQTLGALNKDQRVDRTQQLIANMERLRWLPKDLGKRHVFVNQPAFSVRVMDGQSEIWRSQVIVGKPTTQTSLFHDEIETVVFNPSWGVPQSIIANEYLPKLRNDPGYLDRIGFKVVDARGKVVRSSSVDWWSYGSKVPYGVQQPPGRSNALGELKFLFPNSHDIYMHDTPNRELFDRDQRAFSHGCVRVQNPREFAAVLLGWDAEKVDANTDSKKSQTVKLAEKVPVHLTYFTAWPDDTGKIQYFDDIYGRDRTMENARSTLTLAQR